MRGVLRVLDKTGDSEYPWDTSDEGSVAVAEREFDKVRAAHGAVLTPSGKKLDRFDPSEAEMIGVPQMVGG
jgi:hypothetical protein